MIRFDQVSKDFGEVKALDKISLKIEKGEFVFLIGPSGSGKTTLINLLLRDYPPTAGKIEVAGVNIQTIPEKKFPEYRRRIGVAFQDFQLLTDQTVFENVALALKVLGEKPEILDLKVKKVLQSVGLENRADFFPAQLAGGEIQRVSLARAIVGEPEIVIADEPTGNLDLETARQIVDLLKKINEKGKTVIMATHNFEIVNSLGERVIELDQGKVVSDKKKGKYKTL